MGADDPDNKTARLFARLREHANYRQDDPERNQAWLPTGDDDAFRLGASPHSGSHPAYDRFMQDKYVEIGMRAEEHVAGLSSDLNDTQRQAAIRQIYLDADRDMEGLQRWTKWALQATDADGNPILVLNDGDGRIPVGQDADGVRIAAAVLPVGCAKDTYRTGLSNRDKNPFPTSLRDRYAEWVTSDLSKSAWPGRPFILEMAA